MPDVSTELQRILDAVYGEEVRGSIHDAIEAINDEVDSSDQVALRNSISPVYSASDKYAVGDYVFYDGSLYRCRTAITTAEAWTPAHWTQVAVANDVSNLKSAFVYEVDNALNTSGAVKLYPKMERGDLYVDSSGNGTYYEAGNRIRTSAYHPLKLSKGDVISTDNPSNSVFIVYKKENGLYTSVHSFSSDQFVVQSDGEYEIVARYPVQAYISDVQTFTSYFNLIKKNNLDIVSEKAENNRHAIENLNAFIDEDTPLYNVLELGDLYVDNAGNGTYYVSSRRVRNNKDYPLKLKAGDAIYTTDTSGSVFIVYKKENGLYTSVHSFSSVKFVAQSDGEYEIVARYPAEAYIQDPEAFMKLFYLARKVSLLKLNERVNEKIDDLFSSEYGDNLLTPYLEFGDLYVDSEGEGTYHDSFRRIRTIQNQPIELKAGDILYTSNTGYVFNIYKKESDGKYTVPVSGFKSGDQLIDCDGQYEIVARYSTEASISDFEEITSAIRVRRFLKARYDNENRVDTIGVFDAELEKTVKTVQSKTINRGLLFGIVTDTHVNKTNAGYYDQSIANLKRLNDRLNFNGIIHLGDIVNGWHESNAIVEYHIRYAMEKLLSICPSRTMVALGNHDDNHFSGDSEKIEDCQAFGLTQRFNENNVIRTLGCSNGIYENRSSNFYIDYPGYGIRLIFIDSTYEHTGFSTTAIAWARSVIEEAPNDYHFVFMSHCGITTDVNGGYGIANLEQFDVLLEEYKSRIYCYICGHTHFDYVNYPHGFAQVALNCTVPNQPSQSPPEGAVVPDREIGTETQDCISILYIEPESNQVELIRFGAGDDRTIPFVNTIGN